MSKMVRHTPNGPTQEGGNGAETVNMMFRMASQGVRSTALAPTPSSSLTSFFGLVVYHLFFSR